MLPGPDPAPGARPSRLVGVLGGMGPRATVDFYDKLVALSGAGSDQEHVRVLMWADPTVPSRQDAVLGDGTAPEPWLRHGLDVLVAGGAEIIVVPCNTVHHFLPGLLPDGVEFLDIVETTLAALDDGSQDGAGVGLLATDALLETGLYQRALERAGRPVVLPAARGQAELTALVGEVKSGLEPARLLPRLEALVAGLRDAGAGTVVTACTELSTIAADVDHLAGCRLLDPSRELALATISRSRTEPGTGAPHRHTNG